MCVNLIYCWCNWAGEASSSSTPLAEARMCILKLGDLGMWRPPTYGFNLSVNHSGAAAGWGSDTQPCSELYLRLCVSVSRRSPPCCWTCTGVFLFACVMDPVRQSCCCWLLLLLLCFRGTLHSHLYFSCPIFTNIPQPFFCDVDDDGDDDAGDVGGGGAGVVAFSDLILRTKTLKYSHHTPVKHPHGDPESLQWPYLYFRMFWCHFDFTKSKVFIQVFLFSLCSCSLILMWKTVGSFLCFKFKDSFFSLFSL